MVRRIFAREDKAPEGAQAGPPSDQETEIVAALKDLRDRPVLEVMTPRVDVVALPIPVHAVDVAQAVRESSHSYYPVYDGDLDRLVGVLHINDLFRMGWPFGDRDGAGGNGKPGRPTTLEISRRFRKPYVVPESRLVLDVLADMRRDRRAFAVVVDEYGGVAGVVSTKDLVEEIVGDMRDEFDEDDEPDVVRVDPRRWLVSGQISIDDLEEQIGLALPEGEYVTLGGYLFDALEKIPDEGAELTVDGWMLRVVDMDRRRVAKVLIQAPSEPADPVATSS